MAEEQPLTEAERARQVRQHLVNLRAAGVEWLPTPSAVAAEPTPDTATTLPPAPAAPVIPVPAPSPAAAPALAPAPREAALQKELVFEPVGAGPLTPEQRRQELTVLAATVARCQRCPELVVSRTQTVFGVGPLDVELCFVGEAPGQDEDRQGEPFVGAAGQLLNRIIAACGLKREEVYICNILRCRPPANRQPQPAEAHNCREYLERTLELVAPKFICTLGASASKYLLGTSTGIMRLRGKFFEYRGIPVMCTYHPSFLLRLLEPEKTARKREVWEDMKQLLTRMGRPIPPK